MAIPVKRFLTLLPLALAACVDGSMNAEDERVCGTNLQYQSNDRGEATAASMATCDGKTGNIATGNNNARPADFSAATASSVATATGGVMPEVALPPGSNRGASASESRRAGAAAVSTGRVGTSASMTKNVGAYAASAGSYGANAAAVGETSAAAASANGQGKTSVSAIENGITYSVTAGPGGVSISAID